MKPLMTTTCNESTLTPFIPTNENVWNVLKVKHAFRRLGFGASQAQIDAALEQTPSEFIDAILNEAINKPLTETPEWGYFTVNDFNDIEEENSEYIDNWRIQTGNDLLHDNLRGRLTFFWMNHFVTELETYNYAPYMFQYYNVLQTHAIGNFKTLVREIGINSTMLYYLNGFENTNTEPNENYARELYELFTLGEGNGYTQQDIVFTSQALTGYNHWDVPGGQIYFDASTFYDGDKTIFGQTGNWGYDDVIDILFQEKGDDIAKFICAKLYRYFVSHEIDELTELEIIRPLAQTLVDNNFELAPILSQLFKSEHFFDENAFGVIIKSPYDVILNFVNESELFYNDPIMNAFIYYADVFGQIMYDPEDVSGWQRDEEWINSSTLPGRWQFFNLYLDFLLGGGYGEDFRNFAKNLSNNSNDPLYITTVIINHFISKDLYTEQDYHTASDIFKWEIPQNYYDDGLWNLDWDEAPFQVTLLLKHIASLPEFQLK